MLVKCFFERILKDFTESLGICPRCGSKFGRETIIRAKPAIKIIGGKVFWKK